MYFEWVHGNAYGIHGRTFTLAGSTFVPGDLTGSSEYKKEI